jgi:hypothetical protein
MNDGHMPNEHIIPNNRPMRFAGDVDDTAILNVAAGTNADAVAITPHHAVEPDAAACTDMNIANDLRAGGNEHVIGNDGRKGTEAVHRHMTSSRKKAVTLIVCLPSAMYSGVGRFGIDLFPSLTLHSV